MDCATLTVPMNYRKPGDGKLNVAISRRKAKDPAKRQGVLLLNPGGPGGSGLLMPSFLESEAIGTSYDLIGFDPRGVGRSTQLMCEVAYWEPPRTRPTDDQFPAIAAAARAREAACQRAGGGLRPFVSTANTARDMDVIREALGEKKINYLGFSYGTYLGAVYGSLFPSKLNRSVLDSSMHPEWFYYEASKQQAVAVNQSVDAWVKWVAARDKTYHLGSSVAQVSAALDAIGKQLAAKPIPWPDTPDFPQIDRNVFDQVVGFWATPRPNWALLAELVGKIKESVGGTLPPDTGKGLHALNKALNPETFNEIFPTVTCEADWPADLNVYYEQMRLFRERYPYGRGANAAEPTECTFRSFTPPERLVDLKRKGYPTGLVIQAEFDPATQYDGGPAMASKLNDNLVSIADEGSHGQYGNNPCATEKINDYLINGVLPGSRTTCAGAPRPDVPADGDAGRPAPRSDRSFEERANEMVKTLKLDRKF
ncbi:alpha/beta hydrolase [Actinosynnema sp. ALI-1.44]|nr:alpha/beta hydrolase [Actinosynnema sp. ALI-1.44]